MYDLKSIDFRYKHFEEDYPTCVKLVFDDNANAPRTYAGTVSGKLWMSDDLGETWHLLNDTFSDSAIVQIEVNKLGDVPQHYVNYKPGTFSIAQKSNALYQLSVKFANGDGYSSYDRGKTFTIADSLADRISLLEAKVDKATELFESVLRNLGQKATDA